ncbi:hypothetical protein HY484_02480 [Candidatus Woesearchaeota archaeon]|nr:hypothetical protein [Candidatus Woesearchaeota archaeon]
MKKSVLLLLVFVLTSLFSSASHISESQENVVPIQTPVCPVGQARCFSKAWQVCDGTKFVTKNVCALQEVCDVEKGCVSRKEKIVPTQRGLSKDFYYWRYKECRIGQIQCNKRFIRECINNKWFDSFCPEGEFCHPVNGCTEKPTTRFRERELNIPKVPRIPLLRYY